jgi:hypothetical protein
MARGANLSAQQVQSAVAYNRNRLSTSVLTVLKTAMGMVPIGSADEAFARAVADWQEINMGSGEGDGKLGPKTEASLGIAHPKALAAVQRARLFLKAGNILFDDWSRDVRDNDNDGSVDGARERTSDGAHFGHTYTSFGIIRGTYSGLGWNSNRSVTVSTTRTVSGAFRYFVCADLVSRAYYEAGVMNPVRSTALILQAMRNRGYVWRKSDGYPKEFIPGDFICTLGHGGGHSGIVVERVSTRFVPKVIELPGPSTSVDLGGYDPSRTSDIREGSWSKGDWTYLGRLLLTKLA